MKMVSIQMKIIRTVGLYLITIAMLVKSECRSKLITTHIYFIPSVLRPQLRYSLGLMECENMTFNNEPLFPILQVQLRNNEYRAEATEKLLSTLAKFTLAKSNVTFNSKSFQNFPNLSTLNLISNNLSTLDIGPIPSLRNLNLSHNSLTSLPKTTLQNFNLSSLNVSYNKLSSIYCLNVSTEIDLSHNQFTDSCKFATTIKVINLSYNNITSINDTDFNDLKNLTKLDLSHNYINYIHSQLEDLKELQHLDLSHNDIKQIYYNCFEGLESLIRLDLSYNRIEKIDHGKTNNLEHLRYLDLSYNYIYDLNIAGVFFVMEHLKELKLVGNLLRDFDVDTLCKILKNLEYISLGFSETSCNKLIHCISVLKKNDVRVEKGPAIYQHNVHGILCTPLNNTSLFKNNFEYAVFSVQKVHSLFVAISIFFIIILLMLFVINYYRYKTMGRF